MLLDAGEAVVDSMLYNRVSFERVLTDCADVSSDLGLVTWLEAVTTTPGGWKSIVGAAVGNALQKEAWKRVVKIAHLMCPSNRSVHEVRYDLSVSAWIWLVENTTKFLSVKNPGWGYVLSVARNQAIRAWHLDSSSGLGGRRNLPGVIHYTTVGDFSELDGLGAKKIIPHPGKRTDFTIVEFGSVTQKFIQILVGHGIPRLACERNVSLILACNMLSNSYKECKNAWEFQAETLGISPLLASCWWRISVGSRDLPTCSLIYAIVRNRSIYNPRMLTRFWPDGAGERRASTISTIASAYLQPVLLDLPTDTLARAVKEAV